MHFRNFRVHLLITFTCRLLADASNEIEAIPDQKNAGQPAILSNVYDSGKRRPALTRDELVEYQVI